MRLYSVMVFDNVFSLLWMPFPSTSTPSSRRLSWFLLVPLNGLSQLWLPPSPSWVSYLFNMLPLCMYMEEWLLVFYALTELFCSYLLYALPFRKIRIDQWFDKFGLHTPEGLWDPFKRSVKSTSSEKAIVVKTAGTLVNQGSGIWLYQESLYHCIPHCHTFTGEKI